MDIYFSGYIYIYAYTSVDITTTLGSNIDVENPWFP